MSGTNGRVPREIYKTEEASGEVRIHGEVSSAIGWMGGGTGSEKVMECYGMSGKIFARSHRMSADGAFR